MTAIPTRPHFAVTRDDRAVSAVVLDGFDDPRISPELWAELLSRGETDTVNLTWHWQKSWWNAFGRGQLLLIAVERGGAIVAVAPLFADGGVVFNLCPEDALDFVGDVGEPAVLDALLTTARDAVTDFAGFRFYFIPDSSRTGDRLQSAADQLGLRCFDEGELPSPYLDFTQDREAAIARTQSKSLARNEDSLRRKGRLEVTHLRTAEDILPHLDVFFEQHVARRAATEHPSLFVEASQRDYYRRLTQIVGPLGWLRFTRIDWNDRPIAFHFGLCYRGRYLYGIPSFDVELARRSPGQVLLRQVLLDAIEEGVATFDFGIGDEPYKYRFANAVTRLRTWGLYPTSVEMEAA